MTVEKETVWDEELEKETVWVAWDEEKVKVLASFLERKQ
jgi:hypothetical protein